MQFLISTAGKRNRRGHGPLRPLSITGKKVKKPAAAAAANKILQCGSALHKFIARRARLVAFVIDAAQLQGNSCRFDNAPSCQHVCVCMRVSERDRARPLHAPTHPPPPPTDQPRAAQLWPLRRRVVSSDTTFHSWGELQSCKTWEPG